MLHQYKNGHFDYSKPIVGFVFNLMQQRSDYERKRMPSGLIMFLDHPSIQVLHLALQSLASAIAATRELEAQVIICKAGKEIFISYKSVNVIENSHLPEYLPEEESPCKEIEKAVL